MKFPVNNISITLSELPGEVAIFIEFNCCTQRCQGCHSKHLWTESYFLTATEILAEVEKQLVKNPEVTAICLIGGTTNFGVSETDLKNLMSLLYSHFRLPMGLYSGQEEDLMSWLKVRGLEWLKTGSYVAELGGLEVPTTNQRFYHRQTESVIFDTSGFAVSTTYQWLDITYKFQEGVNIAKINQ